MSNKTMNKDRKNPN